MAQPSVCTTKFSGCPSFAGFAGRVGGNLGPATILKYGQKTNLDMTAFSTCLSDKKYTEAIKKDTADAGTLGISGTPSFVIGKTAKDEIAGVRIVGAVPYTVFDSTIKDLLSAK